MFVSDRLIFLQLQKTAGTHIAAQFAAHLDGRLVGKHGALNFEPGARLVVGSVRNPWDWYVSLWSYGCGQGGGVQGLLKGSRVRTARRIITSAWRYPSQWGAAFHDLRAHAQRDPAFWRDVYADPHDPSRFRTWLRAVLSPGTRGLLGADYADRPLASFAGFYTYRFLSIFTPVAAWNTHANDIRQDADIDGFFDRYGAVHQFIRNEQLEDDLANVFAALDRPEVTAQTLRGDRINASRRDKAETYYDAESAALVAQSDPFLLRRFGYVAP